MIDFQTLSKIFAWAHSLARWNDETLNEFLNEAYGHECAEGYLFEKREKLKRSPFDWICDLDRANQRRVTDIINDNTPSQWWLSLDKEQTV